MIFVLIVNGGLGIVADEYRSRISRVSVASQEEDIFATQKGIILYNTIQLQKA